MYMSILAIKVFDFEVDSEYNRLNFEITNVRCETFELQ